jgi:hypothetical protein
MGKKYLLYLVGVVFLVIGAAYLLAATGIAFEDQLSDSAGGPWAQGLGGIAIGLGAIGWGIALDIQARRDSRPAKSKREYQVGIKH